MEYFFGLVAMFGIGFAFWLWSLYCYDRGREHGRRMALSRLRRRLSRCLDIYPPDLVTFIDDLLYEVDCDLWVLNNEYLRDYRRTGRGQKRTRL